VGEGGDEVSLAGFIADQRTCHRVPHAVSCRALGVSESWFYKWRNRRPTPAQARRAEVDEAVKRYFNASNGTYGGCPPIRVGSVVALAAIEPQVTISSSAWEPRETIIESCLLYLTQTQALIRNFPDGAADDSHCTSADPND
jgi:hypothetical protein